MDLTLIYKCATNSPFKILQYRYAGLGWRATEEWNNTNSRVLTSAGKTRKDADGSLARWFFIQGKLEDETGGILFCSYPDNYNHPEPVRIWAVTMNERGDIFANFAPTKTTDWLIEPGKSYVLRYRLVIYNGNLDAGEADTLWMDYAESDE